MNIVDIRLSIDNPFDTKRKFKPLWYKARLVTAHKGWEAETYVDPASVVLLSVAVSAKEDHAGFRFSVGLFSFVFNFMIYDTRHWDYETNEWSKYYDEN